MNIRELNQLLEDNAEAALQIMLPSGEFIPEHFHVTEVGRVHKQFVDCGGTRRESTSCALQIWTAHDIDHRLAAGKLRKIIDLAAPILESDELRVEVEYGQDVASLYFVADVEVTPRGLLFVLAAKETDCLAKEKCGVESCGTETCCQ
jgi:hypothetical protein